MNFTYKQIWLINFPVMMSLLMEQLINLTDTIFLGHVGEVELGASALAGMYYIAIYMLGFGFSLGLQVMIARRNGERNLQKTGEGNVLSDHAVDTDVHILQTLFPDTATNGDFVRSDLSGRYPIHKLAGL